MEREAVVLVVGIGLMGIALAGGIADTSHSPFALLRSVGLADGRWTAGFWAEKFELCHTARVPAGERRYPDVAGIFIEMRGSQERVHLRLIPYFAWANRGQGRMAAWLELG